MGGTPNFENRTLYHGDNLEFLQAINSNTIDLIATDPPFNTGRDFHATTPEALKKGVGFQDRWTWDEEDGKHQEWVKKVKEYSEDVYHVIEGSRKSYGDDMGAFLCFMGARLLEMQRILKDTGSMYLHCDPTASHYLKELMDAIFGRENFRNEILWCYRKMPNKMKGFQKNHDVILFYSKTSDYAFNALYGEMTEGSRKTFESAERRGYNANLKKRMVTIFNWNKYEAAVKDGKIPNDLKPVEFKDGRPLLRDWWDDIKILGGPKNKERRPYPTQKPLTLYRRIIEASSNPGDVVLDPFCGCATTLVAAEQLRRQWIGMDLWKGSYEEVLVRLGQEGLANKEGVITDKLAMGGDIVFTSEPPMRTDDKELAAPYQRAVIKYNELLAKWQKLPTSKIREYLAEAQASQEKEGWVICAGCGRELEEPFMELDHITPKKDRRIDDISNRILICKPCNQAKSYKLSISGLWDINKKPGKNGKSWLHDIDAAKQASDRAEEQVNIVKRKYRE